MNTIVYTQAFDISNIQFDDKIRNLDTGAKMKYVSYKRNPFVLQTPECYLPYGINRDTMDDENSNKFTMDLSFRDMENRPGLKRFFNILKAFDDHIVQTAFENQKEWLRKQYPSKDVVEALYVPMIRYSKDKDSGEITNAYPPTFKMKIPFSNDKFACDFFDYSKKPMETSTLLNTNTKGARVITLVKCNGIWFAGGKFGCSWKCVQCQIAPKINNVGCAIVQCDEDCIDDIESNHLDSEEEEEDFEYDEPDDSL
jgi:hypothetical protein